MEQLAKILGCRLGHSICTLRDEVAKSESPLGSWTFSLRTVCNCRKLPPSISGKLYPEWSIATLVSL
jgi:hypothetical protein